MIHFAASRKCVRHCVDRGVYRILSFVVSHSPLLVVQCAVRGMHKRENTLTLKIDKKQVCNISCVFLEALC